MDVEGIGLVLARASELRSKITNCIQKSSTLQVEINASKEGTEIKEKDYLSETTNMVDNEENLFDIRDAFESLEAQLSSLQALQQQQFYEREAALAEIDYSRQKLLKKLKEYQGEDLEVINEATAFASETVDDNNDLLLPPYPNQPSQFPSTRNFPQNGVTGGDLSNELRTSSPRNQSQLGSRSSFRAFISVAAKTLLTLVGVVSVMSLAGVEPRLKERKTQILGLFQWQGTKEKRPMVQCPPGGLKDRRTAAPGANKIRTQSSGCRTLPKISFRPLQIRARTLQHLSGPV